MGGLSTDLVIEQVLMRSIKSTGGLTRGRGLGSTQRTLWLLSMPACSEVHEAMQNLTATQYHSNKEHVEASNSRKVRDSKDIAEIEDFLKDHNPFTLDDSSLRNIETGATADAHVNADDAKMVGEKIIEKMSNKIVMEHTFKRKDQVVPLNAGKVGKAGAINEAGSYDTDRSATYVPASSQSWRRPVYRQFSIISTRASKRTTINF